MNKKKIQYLGISLGLFFVFPWIAVFLIEVTAPELKPGQYKLGVGFCLDIPAECTATPNNFEGVNIYCASGTIAELTYYGEANKYLKLAKKVLKKEINKESNLELYSYEGKNFQIIRTLNEGKDPNVGKLIKCLD